MSEVLLHRVSSSPDILKPGDYCFIPKKEPIRTVETIPGEPPKGYWKRLVWAFFGVKTTTKETIERVWPDFDCVIMACPHCSQPIGTTKEHQIESVEPLTIDRPIACAYSKPNGTAAPTIAFTVKDGTIMPA